jgi:hypothetical protein
VPCLRLLHLLARRQVSPDHLGETRIAVGHPIQIGGAHEQRIGRNDGVDGPTRVTGVLTGTPRPPPGSSRGSRPRR